MLSMLAPPPAREDIWALLAFNHEIAKTRSVVSEGMLGMIRLKWWQEAVDAVYSGGLIPAHEVMQPLVETIKRHDLKRESFEQLIEARAMEMQEGDFPTLDALMNYAAATTAPLWEMIVKAAGQDPAIQPVYAASLNVALTGLVRGIPFAAAQGRCLIPVDVLERHGLERMQVISGQAPLEHVSAAVQEILAAFEPKLLTEFPMLRGLQALSSLYMGQIKACRYNPFDAALARPPALKVLRVLIKTYILQ